MASGFEQLSDSATARSRRTRQLGWRILFPLWLGYFLCFIDRSNLSVAKIQMKPQLGLSEAQLGLAGGLFWLSYATLQVPSNYLVARIGGRRVLGAILLVTGASAALTATVQSFGSLLVLRLLLGFAEAGFYPGCVLYLSRWFPPAELGAVTAIFTSANQMGDFVGNVVAAMIIDGLDGALGLSGWRWVFLLQGLPALLVGLYLLRALPDRPSDAAWIGPEWRAQLEALQPPATSLPMMPALRATLARPVTYGLLLLRFADQCVAYSVAFELATLINDVAPASWPLALTGLCAGLPFLLSVFTSIRSAAWLDERATRRGRHHTHIYAAWGAVGGAAVLVLCSGLLMVRDGYAQVPGGKGASRRMLVLLGLAIPLHNVYHGPFWAVHHALQPPELHAVSIGFCNGLGATGGLFGPFLLGALHDSLGPACSASGGSSDALDEAASALNASAVDDCIDEWGWGVTVLAGCALWVEFLAFKCLVWPAWAKRHAPRGEPIEL